MKESLHKVAPPSLGVQSFYRGSINDWLIDGPHSNLSLHVRRGRVLMCWWPRAQQRVAGRGRLPRGWLPAQENWKHASTQKCARDTAWPKASALSHNVGLSSPTNLHAVTLWWGSSLRSSVVSPQPNQRHSYQAWHRSPPRSQGQKPDLSWARPSSFLHTVKFTLLKCPIPAIWGEHLRNLSANPGGFCRTHSPFCL